MPRKNSERIKRRHAKVRKKRAVAVLSRIIALKLKCNAVHSKVALVRRAARNVAMCPNVMTHVFHSVLFGCIMAQLAAFRYKQLSSVCKLWRLFLQNPVWRSRIILMPPIPRDPYGRPEWHFGDSGEFIQQSYSHFAPRQMPMIRMRMLYCEYLEERERFALEELEFREERERFALEEREFQKEHERKKTLKNVWAQERRVRKRAPSQHARLSVNTARAFHCKR